MARTAQSPPARTAPDAPRVGRRLFLPAALMALAGLVLAGCPGGARRSGSGGSMNRRY